MSPAQGGTIPRPSVETAVVVFMTGAGGCRGAEQWSEGAPRVKSRSVRPGLGPRGSTVAEAWRKVKLVV